MRKIFVLIGIACIVAVLSGCKKITQDQLIKGLWKINTVYIDSSTTNYLNTLPHFTNGNDCCAYKLDFEADNTVIAYYLAYDNFEKIVAGNFEVTGYNQVFIKVDSFMDGTFKITQPTIRKRKLNCDNNHIKAFDGTPLDTAATAIEMEKI